MREATRGPGVALAGILGALTAALCCAGPLLLAILGVLTVPVAGMLAEHLFYRYWWAFIIAGLVIAATALTVYFRRRGICTLNEVARQRGIIINAALLTLIVFIVVYLLWDFVIVEWAGIRLGLWHSPFRH